MPPWQQQRDRQARSNTDCNICSALTGVYVCGSAWHQRQWRHCSHRVSDFLVCTASEGDPKLWLCFKHQMIPFTSVARVPEVVTTSIKIRFPGFDCQSDFCAAAQTPSPDLHILTNPAGGTNFRKVSDRQAPNHKRYVVQKLRGFASLPADPHPMKMLRHACRHGWLSTLYPPYSGAAASSDGSCRKRRTAAPLSAGLGPL